MDQPYPQGHWTARLGKDAFKHLEPGRRYEVTQRFTHYDGDLHPVGETWRPHYHASYSGAYARDPDGNKLQAVCHGANGQPALDPPRIVA